MKFERALFWVSFFSIAMGYLESSVVVYLRAILYPDGFSFPLVTMNHQLAFTEIFREAATIIMLAGIGILAGRTGLERFAWFLYSFAMWDIFYYVFLKILLNWPESLLTWDILFLIPMTWVGPVIAPVITSLTMIVFALLILYASRRNHTVRINTTEWTLLISGSVILLISFTWDYTRFILQHYSFSDIWNIPGQNFHAITSYVPASFTWWIFLLGEAFILVAIARFWKKTQNVNSKF